VARFRRVERSGQFSSARTPSNKYTKCRPPPGQGPQACGNSFSVLEGISVVEDLHAKIGPKLLGRRKSERLTQNTRHVLPCFTRPVRSMAASVITFVDPAVVRAGTALRRPTTSCPPRQARSRRKTQAATPRPPAPPPGDHHSICQAVVALPRALIGT
jgi:hypothetical protein